MSLANYTDLQASVADWLHRVDLTSLVPDFIALAESKLNDVLRLRMMETTTALVTVASQDYAPLPAGYLEPIACYIDWGAGKVPLTKRDADALPFSTTDAAPDYWAIDGANVRFAAPISSTSAYTISLRHYGALAIATPNTAATWLLTNHPDVYLYGSLLAATPYILGDKRLPVWGALHRDAMKSLQNKEKRSKRALMRMDSGLITRRSGTERIN